MRQNLSIHSLSIAAPAYNEEAGIGKQVLHWIQYFQVNHPKVDLEIVICNDGSRDQTGKILDDLAEKQACVRPIHHIKNQGAAAALSNAIANTTKEWVLLLDADGQFPVSNFSKLENAVLENCVLAASGFRIKKIDSTFNRLGSFVSGSLCNWTHRSRYRDFNCALKLIHGNLIRSLPLEAVGMNYSTEITSKLIERNVRPVETLIETSQDPIQGNYRRNHIKRARDRFLFVIYSGLRQALIRRGVIKPLSFPSNKN